jgi:hypothetical protein
LTAPAALIVVAVALAWARITLEFAVTFESVAHALGQEQHQLVFPRPESAPTGDGFAVTLGENIG